MELAELAELVAVGIAGLGTEDSLEGIADNVVVVQVVRSVAVEAPEELVVDLAAGQEILEAALSLEVAMLLFVRWVSLGLLGCPSQKTVEIGCTLAPVDVVAVAPS